MRGTYRGVGSVSRYIVVQSRLPLRPPACVLSLVSGLQIGPLEVLKDVAGSGANQARPVARPFSAALEYQAGRRVRHYSL